MTLRIVKEPPPCYAEIIAAFPFATRPGTYFCYGRAIFIPTGRADVSKHLMEHEEVHAKRQELHGGPARWWLDYIHDTQFRLNEELLAHQAEVAHFDGRPRGIRRIALRNAAHRLSSPLYRLGITPHMAKLMICAREP